MTEINVLVTGAGALLGQGILRTLRDVKGYKLKIISADPDFKSSGHWLADVAVTIPLAKENNYISRLEEFIKQYLIDIVFIGTDVELYTVSDNKKRLEQEYSVKIVVSNTSAIEIGDDKWLTTQFLKDHNFPYPKSFLSDDLNQALSFDHGLDFPLIAKPRVGARSIGLHLVKNDQQLNEVIRSNTNYIIQECIPDDEGEFTAGVIIYNDTVLSNIILRRDLRDGNTYRAYHEGYEKFKEIIAKMALELNIEGPCNFQFRVRNNEPVVFEINSRFSGTTPIRSIFGINELQVVLDYFFKDKTTFQFDVKNGVVLRTISDLFISQKEWKEFEQNQINEKPRGQFKSFN
ncbi:MAG: ATP-grasp domain-containing protein [Fulvivirga sp.]